MFLDEPTTGFDPAARRTAWDVIRRLRELGKTVLLTTHYLDEAQELSDRVAIVKDGQIVAEGPPRELVGTGAPYRVTYDHNGRRAEHETDDPTALLHRLTSEALERGERLENLHVSRPSLEDVYLELTQGGGVTLLLHQLRFERMLFRRNPSAAFFNFVLPLVLLLLVASVFADDDEELEVLIPGIAGMAIMATTFTALAFNMMFLREQGILKRIHGTPIPAGELPRAG